MTAASQRALQLPFLQKSTTFRLGGRRRRYAAAVCAPGGIIWWPNRLHPKGQMAPATEPSDEERQPCGTTTSSHNAPRTHEPDESSSANELSAATEDKENFVACSECICGCRICNARVDAFRAENGRLMRQLETLKEKIRALEGSSDDTTSSPSVTRRPPTPVGKVTPISRKNRKPSTSTDTSQHTTISTSASREIWSEDAAPRQRSNTFNRNAELHLPQIVNQPPLQVSPIARPIPRNARSRTPPRHDRTPVMPSRSPIRLPPGSRPFASSMNRLPMIGQPEHSRTPERRAPSLRSRHASPNRTFIIAPARRADRDGAPFTVPANRRRPPLRPSADQSTSSTDEQIIIERMGSPTLGGTGMTLMQRLMSRKPEFVRHLEERQDRIKHASLLRKTIHQRKLHTAALLAEDLIPLEDALPVLREDPNRVRAFTPESVRGRTQRLFRNTNEYQQRQEAREREVERAAARIIAHFAAEEQRRYRLGGLYTC
ncbi:unnamed protein product, partial [Mesorhabditis spiculigera]